MPVSCSESQSVWGWVCVCVLTGRASSISLEQGTCAGLAWLGTCPEFFYKMLFFLYLPTTSSTQGS